MGVIMEKKRIEGGSISQTRITTTHHSRFVSLSLSLFSLRALIPCPAKHWANVELFRSLVRSMTRRAHLHLCCFSSIMIIKIGCHSIFNKKKQKKRFIRLFLSKYSFFFLKKIKKETKRRTKFFSFNNDYYANEYCIDILSFRLSIYIVNANYFSQENFLAMNNKKEKENFK